MPFCSLFNFETALTPTGRGGRELREVVWDVSENLKSLIAHFTHFLSPVCSPNTISLSYGSTSWLKGRPTGGTLIFANIWGAGHLSERVCWWVWPDPTAAAAAAAAVSAKLIQTYYGRIQGGDDPFCSETFLRLQLRLNVEYLPVTPAHHTLYETGNTKIASKTTEHNVRF